MRGSEVLRGKCNHCHKPPALTILRGSWTRWSRQNFFPYIGDTCCI
jgi:hypothetical protein